MVSQFSAASDQLQEEIKKIEAISDEQVSRAARNIMAQHEEVVRQLNSTMSGSTEEFSSTADEMREAAANVVREIEFARTELRRAVLELPAETRSSADAMRKVVSDQITALNALADVVKRQSTALSMSGPGIYIPPEGRGRSPGKTEAPASIAATRTSGARKEERSEPAEDDTRSARSGSPARTMSRFLGSLLSGDDEAGIAASRATSVRKSASRETEALVAKLNAASRDVYEALQDGLPKELEKPYREGQAQVYTHRLFQGRGRKLMDQVRTSYRDEKLVRQRVDGFIRLFERLLDTVAGSDAGEELVDQCLASETGKVYLMLAEAAGRVKH